MIQTDELVSEPKTKIETQDTQDFKDEEHYEFEYADIDLSEEFLSRILKQVDELCDAIQNGDPSLERTTIVNQNLNDAVSCYRNRIILVDPKFVETKVKEDAISDDLPDDLNDFFEKVDNESDYVPEKSISDAEFVPEPEFKKKVKKKERGSLTKKKLLPYLKCMVENELSECSMCKDSFSKKSDLLKHLRSMHKSEILDKSKNGDNSKPKKQKTFRKRTDEYINKMLEMIKSQCGEHSVASMAKMAKMPETTVALKIKQKGIVFQKRGGECHFCRLKKNMVENNVPKEKDFDSTSFLSLKYDKLEKKFYCSVCNKSSHGTHEGRKNVLRHIMTVHQKGQEIELKPTVPLQKDECEGHICRELYGLGQRQLWCKHCDHLYRTRPKKPSVIRKAKTYVCPICGINITSLKNHLDTVHTTESHICSQCGEEFSNMQYLKTHISRIHQKIPCVKVIN